MTAKVTTLHREGGPLTKAQRELVKEVPGVAERVTYELGHTLGGDPRSSERVQMAHLGIVKAAQSYDGTRGKFETWAKVKAASEILTTERKQRKQKRLVTAGRIAGLRFAGTRRYHAGDVPHDATDEALFDALVGVAEEHIVAEWLGVLAADDEPPEGDDEIAEREQWGVLMAALLPGLSELTPENQEFLLLFAHDHDISAVAKERGVDYGTLLDTLHEQLALLRARIKGRTGISKVPKRPKDAVAVLPHREPSPPRVRRKRDKRGPDE